MTIFGGLKNKEKFDIFAFDYYKGEGADKKGPPISNYYLMGVIVVIFISLIL